MNCFLNTVKLKLTYSAEYANCHWRFLLPSITKQIKRRDFIRQLLYKLFKLFVLAVVYFSLRGGRVHVKQKKRDLGRP